MVYDDDNIFAKIIRGDIEVDRLYEDEHVLAFPDHAPKAPVHILVVPKGAYVSLADFSQKASSAEIEAFTRALGNIARERGLESSGYRTIMNHGKDGGQEVFHYHAHILGGKSIGPLVAG